MIDENAIRVSELEAEVRTSERLANVYRDSSEAADKELAETRESEARLETLVRDREEGLLFSFNIVKINIFSDSKFV